MAKIYTKTGDEGKTSLLTGQRVKKYHPRVKLYGQTDDLNSELGLFLSLAHDYKFSSEGITFLSNFQSVLFDIGALLSCDESKKNLNLREIPDSIVLEIESLIDEMEKILEPLTNFILPNGHVLACRCHLLRTKVRSMEIDLVEFMDSNAVPKNYLVLLNRLSDFFFVLSRFINKYFGQTEKIWK